MHTMAYHDESQALQTLKAIRNEADAMMIMPLTPECEERLTQLLLKLDAIEISGSVWLRTRRKEEVCHINDLLLIAGTSGAG